MNIQHPLLDKGIATVINSELCQTGDNLWIKHSATFCVRNVNEQYNILFVKHGELMPNRNIFTQSDTNNRLKRA